jgi:hemin uptake protein HemP
MKTRDQQTNSTPQPEDNPTMLQGTLAPSLLPTATDNSAVRSINSQQLLGGQNMLRIEHAGQRYILRVTRENKLILTK